MTMLYMYLICHRRNIHKYMDVDDVNANDNDDRNLVEMEIITGI